MLHWLLRRVDTEPSDEERGRVASVMGAVLEEAPEAAALADKVGATLLPATIWYSRCGCGWCPWQSDALPLHVALGLPHVDAVPLEQLLQAYPAAATVPFPVRDACCHTNCCARE